MKKTTDAKQDDILNEYDFTGGVRGKHHKAYRQGHIVRLRKADRTIVEHHFTLEDGAVMLEPDVHEYFSDSEAVNEALRSLIKLIPKKTRSRTRAT